MAIRHLGQFRNVTLDEARLDGRVIKTLFRRGTLTGGVLAGHIGERENSPSFKASLDRLASYEIVEIRPAYHGDSVRVVLLPAGQEWGLDLTCEEQTQGNRMPSDIQRDQEDAAKRA